jgi:hypothetical protein
MGKRKSKRVKQKTGTSASLLLSIGIHVVLFLLAGLLVVFTVVKKEEQVFEPPKTVERPKMKLKKPKVKVKKSSKPKSASRITAKTTRSIMPNIDLPELGGMGAGLGDGIGPDFGMMPDLSELTLFGGAQTIGNDLEGTFYDFRRDRKGGSIPMHPFQCIDVLSEFVKRGWKKSVLSRYYQSPNNLYATTIAIPPVQSALGPQAFGEPDTGSDCYGILYEGELVNKDDMTFRFWGLGDDVLIVAVDGEIVLNGFYPRNGNDYETARITPKWQTSDPKAREYWLGIQRSNIGDWITLKAGEPRDLKILVGEIPGGLFQALLTVEVEGEKYPRNPEDNGPTLPLFKTAELTLDQIDAIYIGTHPGDLCVTNGPVFCDYDTSKKSSVEGVAATPVEPVDEPLAPVDRKGLRTWSSIDGKTLEARYVARMAMMVVMKTAKEKQIKIPFDELSLEDREFVELSNPPKFHIEFSKKSSQIALPKLAPQEKTQRPLRIFDYVFGTRMKQTSTGAYDHKLKVEYFAVGAEVEGDNFILFERQESHFIPSDNSNRTHAFYGEAIRIQQQALRASAVMRGGRYGGFLVTVTDEFGEIIQYKASHDFLYEKRGNLKKLPVTGKVHFNKECIRVAPPRLSPDDRPGI